MQYDPKQEDRLITYASIKGTVAVGPALKHRLTEAARLEGADASWLARKVLREHLDAHERPPGERSCSLGAASALER
jgi:hypothetical protein